MHSPGSTCRPSRSVPAAALRCVAVVCASLAASPAIAQADIATEAEYAILVDFDTGTVLYERDADSAMPPASMAKLMTMALVFEAVHYGALSLEDEFVISEDAWRRGGAPSGTSTMFAEVGSSISIENLMRGVIIQSGNDAAIALAEGLAGTEAAFAERMNEAADRIGLTGSVFTNATGLPDPAQHVTARDLARLATYIIREFPEFYAIYAEPSFTWGGITQSNRNPLLGMGIGADGMKTGYTEESGYGLVGSAVRDGLRLVAVVNGAASDAARGAATAELLEWGFSAFTRLTLFEAGAVVAEAEIYGGTEALVPLRLTAPVRVLVAQNAVARIAAEVVYLGPVPAPIAAGDEVGHMTIMLDGETLTTIPLEAAETVAAGTMPQRARDAFMDLFFDWR